MSFDLHPGRHLRLLGHLLRIRLREGSPRHYAEHWDSYWRSIHRTGPEGEVLWDADPERAIADDLPRLLRWYEPTLPVVDIGCGNGSESRLLAQRFLRVIGVDVSIAAVERARRESEGCDGCEFRLLDATDSAQARALSAEVGDCNLYVRGVFHALDDQDRPAFVATLRTLAGKRGTVYLVELGRGLLPVFEEYAAEEGEVLPAAVERVVVHGLRPVGFAPSERGRWFAEADWDVLDEGTAVIRTLPLGGRSRELPAAYLALRPR
jgi:SAM-dependent methyltransferase